MVESAEPPGHNASVIEARIVAVYPNPIPPNDPGEFVIVAGPPDVLAGSIITDGESQLHLPDNLTGRRYVLTTDRGAVPTAVDGSILELDGRLALANDGDEVRLLDNGQVLDEVRYDRAPEGEILQRTAAGWIFRPLGATSHPVTRVRNVSATAFVLPDSPEVTFETLATATDRIALAGYTVRSRTVVRSLCHAVGRGVQVRVLAEDSPVGGLSRTGAARLDALVRCGVAVRVLGGPAARYAFHHAKYAVIDQRAIVLTENWTPSGVGGNASRGWGVLVDDRTVTAALLEVFRSDWTAPDSRRWTRARVGRSFVDASNPASGQYPSRLPPSQFAVDQVAVIVAPETAESHLIDLIDSADNSVYVEQLSIGDLHQPLLRASIRAARRGVTVRILVSGAWYAREEHEDLVAEINRIAATERIPLEARVSRPNGRFRSIHAKGLIVDGETVVVGSPNWTNHSLRRNREVALVLSGREAGRFYQAAFRADWRGGRWLMPLGVGIVAVATWAVALGIGRRTIRFDSPEADQVTPTGSQGLAVGTWLSKDRSHDRGTHDSDDREDEDRRLPYF